MFDNFIIPALNQIIVIKNITFQKFVKNNLNHS